MIETCDILVIGAGAAGMPAALFAVEGGARVVLAEVDQRIGGTFHLSSGQMSAAGTRVQAEKGITDSPKAHFEDVMRISGGTADPVLVRLAVENAADTLHWLLDNGLELQPDHPIIHYGHEPYTTPRTYWGPEEGRSVLKVLAPMVERAVAQGRIDLRLGSRLQSLEPRGESGVRVTFEGERGAFTIDAGHVILATGGYTADPALFSRLSGGKPLYGGGHRMARGDGLKAARAVGAATLNEAAYLPTFAGVEVQDVNGGVTFATQTYPQFRQPWEIYVDGQGRRFMAEDEPSVDLRERSLLTLDQMQFWAVFDERIRREAPAFVMPSAGVELDRLPGYREAHTLRELAVRIGVHPVSLAETVETYNGDLRGDRPDRFGRLHRPLPLVEPPFHAIRHVGWSIAGFAGLAVDGELRVLDGEGARIPGLFAAGEILGLGATSGNAFVGGMSVTPAMTFGRLLGQRLAREVVGVQKCRTYA